jgi:hypothetical protein
MVAAQAVGRSVVVDLALGNLAVDVAAASLAVAGFHGSPVDSPGVRSPALDLVVVDSRRAGLRTADGLAVGSPAADNPAADTPAAPHPVAGCLAMDGH